MCVLIPATSDKNMRVSLYNRNKHNCNNAVNVSKWNFSCMYPTGESRKKLSSLSYLLNSTSVSYTHLDVYKRQELQWRARACIVSWTMLMMLMTILMPEFPLQSSVGQNLLRREWLKSVVGCPLDSVPRRVALDAAPVEYLTPHAHPPQYIMFCVHNNTRRYCEDYCLLYTSRCV